jgi:hypothetical protein
MSACPISCISAASYQASESPRHSVVGFGQVQDAVTLLCSAKERRLNEITRID